MITTEPPDTVEAEVVIRVIELTILVRLMMLVTLVITITARLRITSVNLERETDLPPASSFLSQHTPKSIFSDPLISRRRLPSAHPATRPKSDEPRSSSHFVEPVRL